MDRPEWTVRANPVVPVDVDVGFLIAETYYYGPENDFTDEQWQQLREPLYQPKVERYGDYLLSAALVESAAELVQYYLDVVRLASHHRKNLRQQSQYFWMRPLIFARGEFAITFPWYDTWEETIPVLDALASARDGLVYHDMDQGWEFQAFAEADSLFLRQSDLDSGEEHFVIETSQSVLASRVPVIRQRVDRLVKELSVALGHNYWTYASLN